MVDLKKNMSTSKSPGTPACDLMWKTVLCRCNKVKDLSVRRSCQVTWVDPKFNDKSEAEKMIHTEEKAVEGQRQRWE